MDGLDFAGKVAVVTGGGQGLGRSHALALAARGARVVVNDLGGTADGAGSDTSVAQRVADEIRAAGGEAIGDTHSVLDGARIIENAIDSFGRVDIVINNAGILRDVAYHNLTGEQWRLVLDVHLNGTHAVTRAAWPHMRAQGYGRIVMTVSAAGIYGNFGQANYSAAKLGMLGLANTLAVEGGAKGIRVNSIAPVAASRLTETVMPAKLLEGLKPELITPLVLCLAHESCPANGALYEAGAGWYARVRWERSIGWSSPPEDGVTPEALAAAWDRIEDFTGAIHPKSVVESLAEVGRQAGVDLTLSPQ
ncbi:SDR family oxidoreductase [Sphingomonas canadensis]|uniref:SDR family oxidoreductase n=1 Tax=Sphingomonas canadensis TaxID=1219257 RepID=A0ABW3H9B7_9SPHN|nr:SDR family oxidoreductase [Sphingomonas canadensis]MCW3836943.1 SDR family oxidoreductase [Sphingomonas canadensis]